MELIMVSKIYIVRKYVLAKNAQDALKKEKYTQVDDVWAEENTHKEYLAELQKKDKTGFK